ncbi:CotH kinase family protein [Microbulbifer rhizosphaerae]|uniref:Right handed beta helix domain-containing protein n=1 Tax=Microbulbifer rhizosphaerae TaxID=1562603 RepID=A0A7W4W856_9GAMM|nr:CotH kinase family protein [Microbulbifer rhizosphaerae]MBB3059431.1 hypothetical protein [Microbulbifer rhizosphaerae]
MNRKRKTYSTWPVLMSVLLIAGIFIVTFDGIESLFKYKKSVEPDIQLTPSTLHYFIKEEIVRKIQAITAKSPTQPSQFSSIYLFTAEENLASLDSDLPSSGKTQTVPGHIKDDRGQLSSEATFRYRGGLPIHWLHKKKSFRVNLPPYTTYREARKFNLVVPTTIETITDWVSNRISSEIGLITPEIEPVRLYVNNEYQGLHFYLDQVDESLLRKHHRMPGSIYSGDTLYIPNPFGPDKDGNSETTFLDAKNMPMLWQDQRLWQKDAARNAEKENDRSDIIKYIETINKEDLGDFQDSFELYFDKEKFFQYWALDSLIGAYHHDYFHNHKLYFDPYKGKFEPIQWDIRFWISAFKSKDIVLYPLLMKAKQIPQYEYQKDLAIWALMEQYPPHLVRMRINEAARQIRKELEADPYRQYMGPNFGIFALNKEIPFSIDLFDEAIERLKNTYSERQQLLKAALRTSEASFTIKQLSRRELELNIAVSGNSPIELDLHTQFGIDAVIEKSYQGQITRIKPGKSILLYPGKRIQPGNISGINGRLSNITFGNKMLTASPLHYRFIVTTPEAFPKEFDLTGKNAITGEVARLRTVSKLPDDGETSSLHPWQTPDPTPQKLILSGNVDILEDRIYQPHQQVEILPGTRIKLAGGASLIFYGLVTAAGEEEAPIFFERLDSNQPWGALVIQGQGASESILSHIVVSGGSVSHQRLIDYPGQINIHDVGQFSIDNCRVSANSIGDDALHVAYSKGIISNCDFEDTAFDAIDIDIADIEVRNSRFSNIGNDALDLMTSKVYVNSITVSGAGDKCISVGEASKAEILYSNLTGCLIGVATKDRSEVHVRNSHITGNREAPIALYRKNPRYSEGGKIVLDNVTGMQETDIQADPYSRHEISFAEHPKARP